jgi:hypothetical protein
MRTHQNTIAIRCKTPEFGLLKYQIWESDKKSPKPKKFERTRIIFNGFLSANFPEKEMDTPTMNKKKKGKLNCGCPSGVAEGSNMSSIARIIDQNHHGNRH